MTLKRLNGDQAMAFGALSSGVKLVINPDVHLSILLKVRLGKDAIGK